ncbi:MAG: hypothetical protein KF756_08180 [Acidobacteria bacterium]|nr:hypothetical protein [Acidobacteriota bacterium]
MLRNILFAISFFIILSFSISGQKRIIRGEYLKITPYLSTLEDVTKVYGEGHDAIKGRNDHLSITYTISNNIEVSIDYFRDCNPTHKPEKERMWIVEEVFFTFEEDLKLKPKDIFLDNKDFTACPYGDVGGQIIYFNKEKDIQFTYLKLKKAVTDLSIMATEKNKERFKCKKDKVLITLDPSGFRCDSPD